MSFSDLNTKSNLNKEYISKNLDLDIWIFINLIYYRETSMYTQK